MKNVIYILLLGIFIVSCSKEETLAPLSNDVSNRFFEIKVVDITDPDEEEEHDGDLITDPDKDEDHDKDQKNNKPTN